MPPDGVRLRHMLDAARKALDFTDGRSRSDLDKDEQLALAVVRLLEIIGEASKKITAETRAAYPGIPWHEIAGTRDRLDISMLIWMSCGRLRQETCPTS